VAGHTSRVAPCVKHIHTPTPHFMTSQHPLCCNGLAQHPLSCNGPAQHPLSCNGPAQHPLSCNGLPRIPKLMIPVRPICTHKCINKAFTSGSNANTRCSACFNLTSSKSNCNSFLAFPKAFSCISHLSVCKIFIWRSRKGRKKVNVKKGYIVRRPK